VSQWDMVGVPVGHGGCPTGAWGVSHWDMVGVPLGHGGCPTGARGVSHWGTVAPHVGHGRAPLRYTERAREKRLAPTYSAIEAYRVSAAFLKSPHPAS
jgi:hypothetical protein